MLTRRRLISLAALVAAVAALVVANELTRPPNAAELRAARAAVYAQLGVSPVDATRPRVTVEADGHDAYARIDWPDGEGAGIELRRSGDGWRLAHDITCVTPSCDP